MNGSFITYCIKYDLGVWYGRYFDIVNSLSALEVIVPNLEDTILNFLNKLELPEKLQIPVVGSITALACCAYLYFSPSDMWVKRIFFWFWESLKEDWPYALVILLIAIVGGLANAGPSPRSFEGYGPEDFGDFPMECPRGNCRDD